MPDPITIATPVSRLWRLWLLITWPPADRGRWVKGPLLDLKFIHAAHWGLVRPRRRGTTYILFQSNFDGPAQEYAAAFAIKVPWRIRGLWWGARAFPGPRPVSRFVDYVLGTAQEGPCHYHAAYPDGTVRTVGAALELSARFRALERRAAGLDPDQLLDAWREFLVAEQHNL